MKRMILSLAAVLLIGAPAFAVPVSNNDIRRVAFRLDDEADRLGRIASGYFRSLRGDHWEKGDARDEEMNLLFEMRRYAASAAMFKDVADAGASGQALLLAFERLEEDAAEVNKKISVARNRQRDWQSLGDAVRQMDRINQVNAQARPVMVAAAKAAVAPVKPPPKPKAKPPVIRLGETGELKDQTVTLNTDTDWPIRALRFTNKGGRDPYIRIITIKLTTPDKKEVNQQMYAKVRSREAIEIPLPGSYHAKSIQFRMSHECDGVVVEGVTAK